jgi:hypothetical protein
VAAGRFAGDAELGPSPVPCFELLESLAAAGFYGVELRRRDAAPWRESDGVEFRNVAVTAHKGKEGPCWEHFQAVMYRGPFKSVEDDDGHVYERGQQIAVCRKTFELLQREPYQGVFEYSEPRDPVAPDEARPFPCNRPSALRDPRELKGSSGRAPASALAPPATARAQGGGHRRLAIFTRSGAPGAGSARELVRSLEGFDGIEVRVVDLAEDEDAPMPAQLRLRLSLSGDACLPALVLDGVVVALGSVPGRDELGRLIAEGRPRGTLPLDNAGSAPAPNDSCDTPGCC